MPDPGITQTGEWTGTRRDPVMCEAGAFFITDTPASPRVEFIDNRIASFPNPAAT